MRKKLPSCPETMLAGTLRLVIVMLIGLLLLSACGGKGASSDESAASGPFPYTNFETGDLNNKTGTVSNANETSLRSADFISISDFITAQINIEYGILYYAYDGNHRFLGASDTESVIMPRTIQEEYPSCAFLKLLVVSKDGSKLDPSQLDEYGLIVFLRSEYTSRLSVGMDITEVSGDYDGNDIRSLVICVENESEETPAHILSCFSHYQSGSSAYPTIQISLLAAEGTERYVSPFYRLGEAGEQSVDNQWRIPPYQNSDDQYKVLIIVPDDVILTIDEMQIADDTGSAAGDPVLYTAYQGFSSLYPPTTLPAFWMAGELGYHGCVVVPQFTSDDVCVCFQDTSSIRTLLRYADGSVIEKGGPDDRPVSRLTYDELMQFDAGLKSGPGFSGKKVPSLDQFFDICSQYDMAPVLSIPSEREFMYGSGKRRLSSIRDMAEQFGVLDTLRIKASDREVLLAAESVFGHDIAGYIVVPPQDADWDPLTFIKTIGFADRSAESMQDSEYAVTIEYPSAAATPEAIKNAVAEGFPVSVEAIGNGISGPVMERLIELGVSEFTVNSHCSIGLNW